MTAFDDHKNLAYSTVLHPPSPASGGAALTVQAGDGANFPTGVFEATVWPPGVQPLLSNAEVVQVNGITGDTFVMARAQGGTNARAIQIGDQIANTGTIKYFDEIEDSITQKTFTTVGISDGADYVCDGVNDEVQINASFAAVSAAGGGTIYFRKATYLVSSRVIPQSNVEAIFESGAVIKQANGSNIKPTVIDCTSITNFKISGLKVDCNSSNNPTSDRGVTLANCTYGLLENVKVDSTIGHGINIRSTGSHYNLVSKCIVTNCGGSGFILSNGATFNKVVDSWAVTCFGTGFYITGSGVGGSGTANNEIAGCYAESCDYGFDVYASGNCRFTSCTSNITNGRDNFHVEDSQNISFTDCKGTGSLRDGIAVYSSDLGTAYDTSLLSNNITFSNCLIDSPVLNGIHFVGDGNQPGTLDLPITNITVDNCHVVNAVRYGIQSRFVTGLNIIGGQLIGCGGVSFEGIFIDSTTTNVAIVGVNIAGSGSNPIKLVDGTVDNVRILGNIYRANGGTNNHVLNSATHVSVAQNTPSSVGPYNQVSTASVSGAVLQKFDMDRAWQFEQDSTGSSSALVMRALSGGKHWFFRGSSSATMVDWMMPIAGGDTTPILTMTPNAVGTNSIGIDINNTGTSDSIKVRNGATVLFEVTSDGKIVLNSKNISSVADPLLPQDVATSAYVNNKIAQALQTAVTFTTSTSSTSSSTSSTSSSTSVSTSTSTSHSTSTSISTSTTASTSSTSVSRSTSTSSTSSSTSTTVIALG